MVSIRAAVFIFGLFVIFLINCEKKGNPVNIVEPSDDSTHFSILSPADSSVKVESTIQIKWEKGQNENIDNVKISLYQDSVLVRPIASNTPNDGSFSWTVTSIASGGNYQIKLESTIDSTMSELSTPFSITSSYSGGFKNIRIDSAGGFIPGNSYHVYWDSTGNPGSAVSISLYKDTVFLFEDKDSTLNDGFTWIDFPSSFFDTIIPNNRYRVKVISHNDPSIFAYGEYFTIPGLRLDPFEPDDPDGLAALYDLSGTPHNRSLLKDEVDWVRFVGDSGIEYVFQCKVSWWLLNPSINIAPFSIADTTFYWDRNYGNSMGIWTAPKSDTFFVKISSEENHRGEYSFFYYNIGLL